MTYVSYRMLNTLAISKKLLYLCELEMQPTLRYDKDDMHEAVRVLQAGGVILYPTDTVWGIGCDATNKEAVQRIFQIKQRAEAKAMLVLLDAPGKLQGYVQEVPELAWDLIDCATKPMTIIYPNARNLAPSLIAEDGSVGIRITQELFSKTLCERLKRPLVSTSANISGTPTPAVFAEISEEILGAVDYVVRFRQDDTRKAQPSSIIKLGLHNEIKIIRE